MPSRTFDPIGMVEAIYDLHCTQEAWLQSLAEHGRALTRAETMIAYHIDIDDSGWRLSPAAQVGESFGDVAAAVGRLGAMLEGARAGTASPEEAAFAAHYVSASSRHMAQPVGEMLMSELSTATAEDRLHYTLGTNVTDVFLLRNIHIDGNGITMVSGGLTDAGRISRAERATWLRISAHIKAGLRLRRRLATQLAAGIVPPEDGAVLDPGGRVVHADGEAADADARSTLGRLTGDLDRARSKRGGRDVDALEVWQGLVDGRWSLVEQIDSDGRRFILAHKNPEGVTDPRGLTALESRVVRLAAAGFSDKLVAYHLGVAEGTVSPLLARAIRKLGVTGRAELARLFGAHPEHEA